VDDRTQLYRDAYRVAFVPVKEQTTVTRRIADELGVREGQVTAAVELLDGGATVPFVARYRKEVTGALDDAQLRTLEERLGYLRELEERRAAILESVRAQGKLDDALEARILGAESKARLEDIYLPFKPKRRTKAQIAREQGLEPLADLLLGDPATDPEVAAAGYVTAEVVDGSAALEGARAILAERFGEDADLVGELRELMWSRGRAVSKVKEGKEQAGAKFSDYFEFAEALGKLPSHRILALFRGEKEDVLDLDLDPVDESATGAGPGPYEARIAARFGVSDQGRPADRWLAETVRWAWRTRLLVRLDLDLRGRLRQRAEDEATRVFANNLRDLLLAAPAGARPTLGLDPGLRTGVKVAVVDGTGKVVATDTIYPHEPRRQWDAALATLARLAAQHKVELIAIGNGTASRETDKLAAELIARNPELPLTKIVVSEAGASVYSASAYASAELPQLDVSLRGAVSIARRLQDPLAELVKIDPKSIGVGQYQHDIPEPVLSRALDTVVEDCVNAVGVDVNTASVPLLTRVSGVGRALAESIVIHRDDHGPFPARTALKDVPRLGPKAFELCAGFLRVRGNDPLDASSVHPESYPVVRRIVAATGADIPSLLGNAPVLRSLQPAQFVDDFFGLPTVTDILAELEKPGRDPRPEFRTATFTEGVEKVADLQPGMVLEGVVTNVAAFGAFIDVGVHQDGLVHVSAMSAQYVADPRDVVKSGDVVRVKVLSVDVERNRIALTLRLEDETARRPRGERDDRRPAGAGGPGGRGERGGRRPRGRAGGADSGVAGTAADRTAADGAEGAVGGAADGTAAVGAGRSERGAGPGRRGRGGRGGSSGGRSGGHGRPDGAASVEGAGVEGVEGAGVDGAPGVGAPGVGAPGDSPSAGEGATSAQGGAPGAGGGSGGGDRRGGSGGRSGGPGGRPGGSRGGRAGDRGGRGGDPGARGGRGGPGDDRGGPGGRSGGERISSGGRPDGDRGGSGGRSGGERISSGGRPGGDRGGSGAERGGDRRGRPEPTGAMADALRRAGFGGEAGGTDTEDKGRSRKKQSRPSSSGGWVGSGATDGS
jgi:protein Tex